MHKFQDLLRTDMDPVTEQREAIQRLAQIVRQSRLLWWPDCDLVPEQFGLLVVAYYSIYDLMLLDLLDESKDLVTPIFVANLDDYSTVEELRNDIPGVKEVLQTPVFASYKCGWQGDVKSGKSAREAVGEFAGISAKNMSQRFEEFFKEYAHALLKMRREAYKK